MKKFFGFLFVCGFFCTEVSSAQEEKKLVSSDLETVDEDFIPLDEPESRIGGLYTGFSIGHSWISHKATVKFAGGQEQFKKTSGQMDYAWIIGFGTAILKDYYTGLELQVMKRTGSKTHYNETNRIGFKFSSQFGMNMDVRFGKLFPQSGGLLFMTAGFHRVLGKTEIRTPFGIKEKGFGSYYPTIGLGYEKKINGRWMIRADCKYSITSNTTDSTDRFTSTEYKVQPQRIGVDLAILRNID